MPEEIADPCSESDTQQTEESVTIFEVQSTPQPVVEPVPIPEPVSEALLEHVADRVSRPKKLVKWP